MNLNDLKIDSWWKLTLYLGIGVIIASLYFQVTFIENKHLFGMGLGLVLIGLSHWIAEKHRSELKPANFFTGPAAIISWKEIRHSTTTRIMLILGIGFVVMFGYLIVRKLI